MRIQPRRFSESPNQNTRGAWCVSAVLLRYVSAILVYLTRSEAVLKLSRSVLRAWEARFKASPIYRYTHLA